jgi:signal transduction histidine kinase
VLVLATAATVVVGWVIDSPQITRIRPDWVPMQPDAALGLALAGAGLLLAALGRYGLAAVLGAATMLFGGAIVAEYALQLSLGIGGGVTTRWIASETLQPGPIALNTAVCLLLAGIALVTLHWVRLLSALFAVGACALSAGALLGYVTGLDTVFASDAHVSMAPLTAASILFLGSTLVWQRAARANAHSKPRWSGPVLAGLGSAALVFLFFNALINREDRQIRSAVEATAYRIRAEIRSEIEERSDTLTALAREWQGKIFRWRGAWESDVRLVISRSPGMDSIEWIKRDGKIGWTYPPDADHPPLVLPTRKPKRDPPQQWVRAVKFSDGTRGLRFGAALDDSGGEKGWLCGVFRSRKLLEAMSTTLPSGYSIRLLAGRTSVYDNRPGGVAPEWSRTLPLQKASSLSLTVQPSQAWLAGQRSFLPQVVLAGGLGLSVLLMWALRAAQVSAGRARSLNAEVKAHEQSEAQIRELNLELEDRVALRTEALERTNDELKKFAFFLSHELRQPISAQGLWAELLDTQYSASLDTQGQEYVAEIRRSVKKMGELIAGQLALSEVSSAPPQLELVDVESLIREVTSDLKAGLEEAGVTVHCEDLPSVRGNPRQLYQLIRNLVDNSIKYRRPGVPLELRLSSRPLGDRVEIRYEDNGRGFAEEDAERVFGVFERGDSREEGFGLGMALCRSIMERHGGTITAEGRPGGGASFVMRFPVATEPTP